ncbi:AfsR/SARP family transcriptional regulator [Streptosporangium vulgare]|uniref:BTAD domain-containing putative transcriptional regulator n=1 Tax=Streptosporangium vulgare TaxID=46190 RepID=A0ABV5T632_9ACTN
MLIGDTPVVVGKNRQRIVLTMLLAGAGRIVTVGEIVEALWAGRPPRTAAEQVQTCIWQLRRSFALAGAAADLIETTSPGYALRVDPQTVDAHRFNEQVADARSLAAQGDRTLAASRFRCALSLFRGPVLAEVDSPAVQAIAAKWEERRLSVIEECIDLELQCGRGRELIDELMALVERYPLREGLRAQLMYGLYCADRRAEALEVYAAGRVLLVDELGLEPGPTLREMHQRVLAGEPVHALEDTPVNVPAQLVADLPDYVGRPEHERRIRAALTAESQGARICGVYGKWSSGKSAMALHVAHQLRDEFPDGQLYADLRGSRPDPVDVGDVLSCFLRSFGVADTAIPKELAERAAIYRSLLDRRRVLIMLDDVLGAGHVWPLIPATPEAALLMTSRSNLSDVPGNFPVEVGMLTVDQSVELLRKVVGVHRIAAEPEAVDQVVGATGRLALSVRAAAARLASRTHLKIGRLAQRLSDPDRRLDELSHGAFDMRSYLAPSVEALDPDTRRVWYAAGMLQVPDFGAWVIAAAVDTPIAEVEPILEHLVDRGLLDVAGTDHMGVLRCRMHQLMGLYARERSLSELTAAQRTGMLDRATDCWLGLAQGAERLLKGEAGASGLIECPTSVCEQMIEMVTSDPGAWLELEAEGLRFAARHRGRLPRVPAPARPRLGRPELGIVGADADDQDGVAAVPSAS